MRACVGGGGVRGGDGLDMRALQPNKYADVLDSRKCENVFDLCNTHHLNIRATVWLVWEALFSFMTAPHQNNAGKRCNQEY